MAVEDHPQFADWSAALDELIHARDALRALLARKAPADQVTMARRILIDRQAHLNSLSSRIDAD
jgi:hypothetical protein